MKYIETGRTEAAHTKSFTQLRFNKQQLSFYGDTANFEHLSIERTDKK
jgi:hypothetical protein